MNKYLKESLRRQRFRVHLRETIRSSKDALNEEDFYKAFVEPFVDVAKAANLASQEIANSVLLSLGVVLTIDPDKQEERLKSFDEKQKAIQSKWEPLMKKVDDSLSSGDADLVAFAFAPSFYFASSFAGTAYDAAAGVGGWLNGTGLKGPLMDILPGGPFIVETPPKDDKDEGKSLLQKLELLFIGTAAVSAAVGEFAKFSSAGKKKQTEGRVIKENKSPGLQKDLQKFFKESGIDDSLDELRKNYLDLFKEAIKEQDDLVSSKVSLATKIEEADTYDDFISSLDSLENIGQDLSKEIEDIKKGVEDGAKKMATSDDFIKKAKEESKKEDLTDSEIQAAATNASFADMKQRLDKKIKPISSLEEKLRSQAGETLEKMLPDSETLKQLRQSKEGLELFNVIQDARSRYNIK